MTNRRLLIVIAVVLIGVFTVMVLEYDGDSLGDKISEGVEELDDEIDDATTQ